MKRLNLIIFSALVCSLGLTTGCSDNEDEVLVGESKYQQDSQNRWVFGPVACVGCRDFIDYATNTEWGQISITTLNSDGEEIAVSDPDSYGAPLHIFISQNSVTDLNNTNETYQYDFYSYPIPDGALTENWDPLNVFVGIIGDRWHPGELELEKVNDVILPSKMSLIDYYPKFCIRKMQPVNTTF